MFFAVLSTESSHPAQFVGVSQGSRLWEHKGAPQYALSPSWPYRMPHNFIQQGNGGYQSGKPFMTPGQAQLQSRPCCHFHSCCFSSHPDELFLFHCRFCGPSKPKLSTGSTSPTSSQPEFYPAEEVNSVPFPIRLIISYKTNPNSVLGII